MRELNNELPDNWASAKLNDIMELFSGFAFKSKDYVSDGIPILRMGNVQRDFSLDLNKKKQPYIPKERLNEFKNYLLTDGDMVITLTDLSSSGNFLGTVAKLKEDDVALLNQRVSKIILNDLLNEDFIFYLLQSPKFRNYMIGDKTGSIQKNTSHKHIYNFECAFPGIKEQQKIVYKIEELFTKLDAGIQELILAKEKLKVYRQSVLKHAFEGKLTKEWREAHKDEIEDSKIILTQIKNEKEPIKVRRGVPKTLEAPELLQNFNIPNSWGYVSVADLLRNGALIDIKDGNHGSNHPKRDEFTEVGLPFITAAQVHKFRVDYEGAPKLSGEPLEKLNVGFSHPGDVILTHKGSVGRVGICTQECVLTPQTTYYRFYKKAFDGKYLAYALSSPIFQLQLSKIKSQTTRDFVSITKQYTLFIPFLSLIEQKEIVKEMDEQFSSIDEIEKIIEMNLSKSKKLRQSILKKAFSGQLVPQDPNDEPAEKLLKRIKAQKEKQKPQRKSKQKRLVK